MIKAAWCPVAISLPLLLAGCGRADVKACEEFVRSGLVSPSSYRLISAHGENMPLKDPDRQSRVVTLEFDAQNRMGATIRDRAYCEFKLDLMGNVPTGNEMMLRAKFSIGQRDMADLIQRGAFGERNVQKDPKPITCCG